MRIRKRHYLQFIILFNALFAIAQESRCVDKNAWLEKSKNVTKVKPSNLRKAALMSNTDTIITIPIVVHILYNKTEENISNEQILSQIDVLNQDYRKQNADTGNVPLYFKGIAADCKLQFCLAQSNPDGGITNGITRTFTQKTSFNFSNDDAMFDSLGGVNAWNTYKYLNMWVVPDLQNNGQALFGYSSNPFEGIDSLKDGIVVYYKVFGSKGTLANNYNKGRTATHEIGHWLGLYHTFEEGCVGLTAGTCETEGDLICDTPPTANSSGNRNCPATQNTCSESSNYNDMTMNFMEYVYDRCMYMFTEGQKTVMRNSLYNYRNRMTKSNICGLTTDISKNENINEELEVYPNITSDFVNINTNKSANYEIFNNSGQKILFGTLSTQQNKIDLSETNENFIFLRITTNTSSKVFKIIKPNGY